MKIMPNKKYNTIALYAALVIAFNVLLVVAILKFSAITGRCGAQSCYVGTCHRVSDEPDNGEL